MIACSADYGGDVMDRLVVGALASALFIVTPNLAKASEVEKNVEVSLAGIDTSTDRGADHALRRIRHAAEGACDFSPALRSRPEQRQARACIDEAVSRAVDELDAPKVTERYRGNR